MSDPIRDSFDRTEPEPSPCLSSWECEAAVGWVLKEIEISSEDRTMWIHAAEDGLCDECREREVAEAKVRERLEALEACNLPRILQGYSFLRRLHRLEEEPIGAFKARLRSHVVVEANGPVRHLGVTEDNAGLIDRLSRYRRDGPSVYIQGPVGTGKSTITAALLERVIRRGGTGFYIEEPDLFDLMRMRIAHMGNPRGEQYAEILERAESANLLVLDDLGRGKRSAFVDEGLKLILRRRYGRELPTVFTSNIDLEAIGKVLESEPLISRIYEMCQGRQETLEGEDWRTGVVHPLPAPRPSAPEPIDWRALQAGNDR